MTTENEATTEQALAALSYVNAEYGPEAAGQGLARAFQRGDFDGCAPETQVEAADPVNHPEHYTSHPSGVECIEITEHMNFCIGNAVKYLWRADLKDDALQDLEKARFYVQREIDRRRIGAEGETDTSGPYSGWYCSACETGDSVPFGESAQTAYAEHGKEKHGWQGTSPVSVVLDEAARWWGPTTVTPEQTDVLKKAFAQPTRTTTQGVRWPGETVPDLVRFESPTIIPVSQADIDDAKIQPEIVHRLVVPVPSDVEASGHLVRILQQEPHAVETACRVDTRTKACLVHGGHVL